MCDPYFHDWSLFVDGSSSRMTSSEIVGSLIVTKIASGIDITKHRSCPKSNILQNKKGKKYYSLGFVFSKIRLTTLTKVKNK